MQNWFNWLYRSYFGKEANKNQHVFLKKKKKIIAHNYIRNRTVDQEENAQDDSNFFVTSNNQQIVNLLKKKLNDEPVNTFNKIDPESLKADILMMNSVNYSEKFWNKSIKAPSLIAATSKDIAIELLVH